jgi:hypothetical protein
MPKRLTVGVLVGLVIWPASVAAAGPNTLYGRVLHAYQTRGSVPACQFTSPQLTSALASVDTYGQQYYADFIAAIQSALDARASGACTKGHHPTGGAQAAGKLPGTPSLPGSVTASTSSGVPAPLIALGIAAALLAAAAGLAALARRRTGRSEWSHGWAETRYHLGGVWSGLSGRRRR